MSTLDGIPVGTLRSNLNSANVTADQWCKIFGHKYTSDKDSNIYCSACFQTIQEINLGMYEQNERNVQSETTGDC